MSSDAYKFSGKDAANYEEWLGPLIFEPSSIEFLSHLITLPVRSILETSCGTGRLTRHLRREFPAAVQLTATDINIDMITVAKDKLNNSGIVFKVADAQQLPFSENSFDLVVNQFGSMFFPDKQRGFDEAFRVLKPEGHFAFATWDRTSGIPLLKLIIDDHIVPLFEGEDTDRFYIPFALHDPRQLTHFLTNAGFTNNKVQRVAFVSRASSPREIVNAFFLRHSMGREVREKAPDAFPKVAETLERAIGERFGTGEFSFELSAWIGIGQK
jgi:ubiquinone/menaquinone biosynthesis C-methylase UbiE